MNKCFRIMKTVIVGDYKESYEYGFKYGEGFRREWHCASFDKLKELCKAEDFPEAFFLEQTGTDITFSCDKRFTIKEKKFKPVTFIYRTVEFEPTMERAMQLMTVKEFREYWENSR